MFRCLSPRMLGLRLSARETIERAASIGFEGVELLVRDVVDDGESPDALADRMADLGLRGGTWPLPVTWRGDADRFRADLVRLPELARVASRLGFDRTATWVMPEVIAPALLASNDPIAATLDLHIDRLAAMAAILKDHGHRLGLEAIGVPSARTGTGPVFVDRLAALDPILDALRARSLPVGLVADSFHLAASGEPVEAALRWGVSSVIAVHVSDVPARDRPDPSSWRDDRRTLPDPVGLAPNTALLRLLSDAGYTGPVLAEPCAGRIPETHPPGVVASTIRQTAEALRLIWPDR